ncbi:MAG: PilT/PilU family type 4a pilus ATPase [Candidatus Omnitrophota bacterium]
MKLDDALETMIEKNISDLFIRTNSCPRGRIASQVEILNDTRLSEGDVKNFVQELIAGRDPNELTEKKMSEFTIWYRDTWRFRVGIFYQRNTPAAVIRKIDLKIPPFEKLNLPGAVLEKFCHERRGMVLLTGITGSGKSTTIASMIEYINQTQKRHVITIEEPIEFTFDDKKSIINQREIGVDVGSYKDALRQFTLHSPDVIYIGNIRDAETCYAAITAAEMGVLVFSTLHTVNAVSTIERMINFFPPHQHTLILNQLAFLLKGVVSQRLLPRSDTTGLMPAYEVMVLSPSVSRLIRENKPWEIPKYISTGDVYGMISFHQCLLSLVGSGKISPQTALEYADKREELEMELRNKGLL